MDKKKIKLNKEQTKVLVFLVKFYEAGGQGCKSIEIIKGDKILQQLDRKGLCFKTGKGWFPSTQGQEYIREYEPRTKIVMA